MAEASRWRKAGYRLMSLWVSLRGPAQRIKRIRSGVQEERKIISNLDSTVADANLRRLLRPASNLLNRVEAGFLDAKVLREERTPAALAKWLREAEKMLQLASQQRKAFELIIKKAVDPAAHGVVEDHDARTASH